MTACISGVLGKDWDNSATPRNPFRKKKGKKYIYMCVFNIQTSSDHYKHTIKEKYIKTVA